MWTVCRLILPALLLWALSCPCSAEDPFAMFEFEMAPPTAPPGTGGDCCAEAGRYRRLLAAMGPLRARWAVRRRCLPGPQPPPPRTVDRHQLNSAFMQRHVRRTLRLLGLDGDAPPAERETFLLRARITEEQVFRLRQLLSGSGAVSLVEADSILEEVLADSELESLLAEGRPRWLRRLSALLPSVAPELAALLVAAALLAWLLISLLLGRSCWFVLSRLAVLVVVTSFFWHWNHLYRRALTERRLEFSAPPGCEAGDRGWTDGLVHYLRGAFSFVSPDAACREYYTRLHVDPFTEVSPGMAAAELVTKLVLHPAEQAGRALGRFYAALGAEVPVVWMLPFTVLSLLFILALVVVACRCAGGLGAGPGDGGALFEPLHVTVEPGAETVYLEVSAEGEVRPVGEVARRRTTVQSARPPRPGWLSRAGGGLARSLSAGVALTAGAVSAGVRAVRTRRAPALLPPPPPAAPARTETVVEEPVSVSAVAGEAVAAAGGRPEVPAPDGGGAGDRPAATDIHTDKSRDRTSAPARDTAAAPMTAGGPDPAGGGGDAGPAAAAAAAAAAGQLQTPVAEVAPRGGGDGNDESPASPFLTRIRDVMDTSLEDPK